MRDKNVFVGKDSSSKFFILTLNLSAKFKKKLFKTMKKN